MPCDMLINILIFKTDSFLDLLSCRLVTSRKITFKKVLDVILKNCYENNLQKSITDKEKL